MTTVKIEGLKELERELQKLSKAAGKSVLRRSLKKSTEPLVATANTAAPVGPTGEYATSFIYSTKLNKRQTGLHKKMFRDDRAAVEGFVGTNSPAGVQQEFGNVHHAPQPALRPAWDQEAQPTLDRLGRHLWDEFEKSRLRTARKTAKE